MKKRYQQLFIVLLVIFFGVPLSSFALDEEFDKDALPIAPTPIVTTTIEDWNFEDDLIYTCGGLSTDYTISLTIDDGTNVYSIGTCDSTHTSFSLKDITSLDSTATTLVVRELIDDPDPNITEISIDYGEFSIDQQFIGTDIYQRIFQGYLDTDSILLLSPDPAYSLIRREIVDDIEVIVPVDTNRGVISFPDLFVSYDFIVRGDLADPSGHFLLSLDENQVTPYTKVSGDTLVLTKNDISITLELLATLLEVKPEVVYTDVDDDFEYMVTLHNLNGSGLSSIQDDGNDVFGLSFEVEARNDSTIANTGLLYDMWPFVLLFSIFFLFFFFYRRNHLKEEKLEIIDDEIL